MNGRMKWMKQRMKMVSKVSTNNGGPTGTTLTYSLISPHHPMSNLVTWAYVCTVHTDVAYPA